VMNEAPGYIKARNMVNKFINNKVKAASMLPWWCYNYECIHRESAGGLCGCCMWVSEDALGDYRHRSWGFCGVPSGCPMNDDYVELT